jgi:hypothetical protein
MLVAPDAAHSQLRLDSCRTWTIQGKRGYVATWGDGERWFIYCSPGSARRWNRIRQALSPLGRCTQDGVTIGDLIREGKLLEVHCGAYRLARTEWQGPAGVPFQAGPGVAGG